MTDNQKQLRELQKESIAALAHRFAISDVYIKMLANRDFDAVAVEKFMRPLYDQAVEADKAASEACTAFSMGLLDEVLGS